MKNILWICNHHATLDGHRHFELAKQFAKRDIKVVVIASSFQHDSKTYLGEQNIRIQDVEKNIKYVWLRTTPAYVKNGGKRILNMFSYVRKVKKYYKQLLAIYGAPNWVIGSSVHPLAWEAAYWISKKANCKFVCEVRDLWPLSFIELLHMSPRNLVVQFFAKIEKQAYGRADKIVTTMPYAYKYICPQYNISPGKIAWIPNGINTTIMDNALQNTDLKLPTILEDYLDKNWCAIYTGSLVKAECVDFILKAAQILQEVEPNIKFVIIGNGHERNNLLRYKEINKLENVMFFDTIKREQVALVLKEAKVCLAALEDTPLYHYGLSMNKLNDYLYSGTPTVFACNAPNVVKDSGGGISLAFGDVQKYVDAILKIYGASKEEQIQMGKKGKEEIKKNYSFEILGIKYVNILEKSLK